MPNLTFEQYGEGRHYALMNGRRVADVQGSAGHWYATSVKGFGTTGIGKSRQAAVSALAGSSGWDVDSLWAALSTVGIDSEGRTLDHWLSFPAGIDAEVIWRWFEETFDVRVADLMGVSA